MVVEFKCLLGRVAKRGVTVTQMRIPLIWARRLYPTTPERVKRIFLCRPVNDCQSTCQYGAKIIPHLSYTCQANFFHVGR
jgi:hypothetical protein